MTDPFSLLFLLLLLVLLQLLLQQHVPHLGVLFQLLDQAQFAEKLLHPLWFADQCLGQLLQIGALKAKFFDSSLYRILRIIWLDFLVIYFDFSNYAQMRLRLETDFGLSKSMTWINFVLSDFGLLGLWLDPIFRVVLETREKKIWGGGWGRGSSSSKKKSAAQRLPEKISRFRPFS